jgi:hypothetical protein
MFKLFLLPGFTGKVVLSKVPIIWLHRARLANTCFLPSFMENRPIELYKIPIPKSTTFIAKSNNTFGGLGNSLSPNSHKVKSVLAEYSAMEN